MSRAAEIPTVPIINGLEHMYTVWFLKGNALQFTFIKFKEPTDLMTAVAKAKLYCNIKNYRFSWLEPSVTELE